MAWIKKISVLTSIPIRENTNQLTAGDIEVANNLIGDGVRNSHHYYESPNFHITQHTDPELFSGRFIDFIIITNQITGERYKIDFDLTADIEFRNQNNPETASEEDDNDGMADEDEDEEDEE